LRSIKRTSWRGAWLTLRGCAACAHDHDPDRAIRAAAGRKLRGERRAAIPTLPWSALAAK